MKTTFNSTEARTVFHFMCLAFGVESAPAQGVEELRARAEKGDAKAQCALGAMYATGLGMPKEDIEAAKWFFKAAVQNDADAQAKK